MDIGEPVGMDGPLIDLGLVLAAQVHRNMLGADSRDVHSVDLSTSSPLQHDVVTAKGETAGMRWHM